MEKRTLGKTGFNVSVLGLGTAPAAFLGTEAARFQKLINHLLDSGVNLLDTAAAYPGSEKVLGQLVGHRRKDFVLVSKCGNKADGLEGTPWSDEFIGQSVDLALKSLGTSQIDVMLLHSCGLDVLKKGEAIGALVKAKKAGKVKHIGYSGDNEAAAYAVTLPEVEVLETSINVADQHNIHAVLPAAVKHNVGVLAKRPIANAAWKDISQQPGMYASYAKTYTERLAKMAFNPADVGIESWPELALRFTLSQPGVTTAIIGTTNPENAAANLAAVAKGPLPAEAVKKLQDAFKAADADGTWLGQQ